MRQDIHTPTGQRLHKVLAQAGIGSRRACEDIIARGRVSVDGQRVSEMGTRVDPAKQRIEVDGQVVQLDSTMLTLALHKPAGVVSTMSDPEGRPSLGEYVASRRDRLFHVGRLDTDTEGLLLLTNDGELANRLAHPSREVPKTYVATVDGRMPPALARALVTGMELEDGFAQADSARILESTPAKTLIEVVIHSGRNRIVRRLLGQAGFPVVRLVRTQIGPVKLGDLKPGRTRVLGRVELSALMADLGM